MAGYFGACTCAVITDLQGSCRVVKRFVDNSDQERGGRKHRSLPGGTLVTFHLMA